MPQPGDIATPPLGRRSATPDVTAPDGSEIRLLLDARHRAVGASMVEVVLPAGQVSRPVYHRTVEEVWYILEGVGQVWRCPPEAADPAAVAPLAVGPGGCPGHPHRLELPVRRCGSGGPAVPVRYPPTLAGE